MISKQEPFCPQSKLAFMPLPSQFCYGSVGGGKSVIPIWSVFNVVYSVLKYVPDSTVEAVTWAMPQ
jgi:hypothetical protein